jgi:pimeloyl-ACP methyl ester carboxylesterase
MTSFASTAGERNAATERRLPYIVGDAPSELGADAATITILNSPFSAASVWRICTKDLARHHRILTLDPWVAEPDDGHAPRLMSDHVECLRMLLDGLNIRRTFLVGASLSTLICRDFALACGDRVAGLVLVGPLFGPFGSLRRKLLVKSWLDILDARGLPGLFEHLYPLFHCERTIEKSRSAGYLAMRERFLTVVRAHCLRASLQTVHAALDEAGRLKEIACPVLLLDGDSDLLSSAAALVRSGLLHGARLERVPFASHAAYFEAPDAFAAHVEQFVQGCAS